MTVSLNEMFRNKSDWNEAQFSDILQIQPKSIIQPEF